MNYKDALNACQARSEEFQCTCYVNAVLSLGGTDKTPYISEYDVADWFDGSTVARFTNGKHAD